MESIDREPGREIVRREKQLFWLEQGANKGMD